jgi:hypothetical protein
MPPKLSLLVIHGPARDEPFTGSDQELYLGRYEWDAGAQRVRLLIRPAVTHLRALKDTEGWEQWTAPVRDKLSGLISYLEESLEVSRPRRAASLLFAYQIGFGWPHLTVAGLSFSLQMLNWLLTDSAHLVPDCDMLRPLAANPSAEELPTHLATYIDREASDFPGQELRPDKEVLVEFKRAGSRVIYTFLQDLRQGRLELHLREQGAAVGNRSTQIRWSLTNGGANAIDRNRDEDPESPYAGLRIYPMYFSQIPQAGYQLTVSGISQEMFERTRLFFIQTKS